MTPKHKAFNINISGRIDHKIEVIRPFRVVIDHKMFRACVGDRAQTRFIQFTAPLAFGSEVTTKIYAVQSLDLGGHPFSGSLDGQYSLLFMCKDFIDLKTNF